MPIVKRLVMRSVVAILKRLMSSHISSKSTTLICLIPIRRRIHHLPLPHNQNEKGKHSWLLEVGRFTLLGQEKEKLFVLLQVMIQGDDF